MTTIIPTLAGACIGTVLFVGIAIIVIVLLHKFFKGEK